MKRRQAILQVSALLGGTMVGAKFSKHTPAPGRYDGCTFEKPWHCDLEGTEIQKCFTARFLLLLHNEPLVKAGFWPLFYTK